MKIEQMREEIARAYSGPAWQYRVGSMSDRQVVAIYNDMKRNGRLEKQAEKKAAELKEDGIQMTIFDLMNGQIDGKKE